MSTTTYVLWRNKKDISIFRMEKAPYLLLRVVLPYLFDPYVISPSKYLLSLRRPLYHPLLRSHNHLCMTRPPQHLPPPTPQPPLCK